MHRSRSLAPFALLASLVLVLAACSADTAATPSDEAEPSSAAPTEAASSAPAETESAAPSAEASEEPEAAEERVRINHSAFDPSELTVQVGTKVVWLNADSFGHTITEGTGGQAVDDPIVDEPIDRNGSVSVTFDEPGTYQITCKIHPSMQMTITVEG